MLFLIGSVLLSGCQTFQPFAQRTREKISSARQWANGGLEAFQCGQLQRAKSFFSRATQTRPEDFRSRANLARTLHQSGETSDAISQMQQAVEQSGNDPNMLIELGEMYFAAGQLSPAVRQAQAALNDNHQLAGAWKLKAKVSRARGELSQALTEFQKAAGFAPNDQDLQLQIAQTYADANQPRMALATIENLLARLPADSQPENVIISKANILIDLQQLPSAMAMLKRASREQQHSEPILIQLAQTQLIAGQFSQAQSTLARGRDLFGDTLELSQLATTIAKQSDSENRLVRVD